MKPYSKTSKALLIFAMGWLASALLILAFAKPVTAETLVCYSGQKVIIQKSVTWCTLRSIGWVCDDGFRTNLGCYILEDL